MPQNYILNMSVKSHVTDEMALFFLAGTDILFSLYQSCKPKMPYRVGAKDMNRYITKENPKDQHKFRER